MISLFFDRVFNVDKMNLNQAYAFPTTDDHSKWAVSDLSSDWICVGDINRAVSKFKYILISIKRFIDSKIKINFFFFG